MSDFTTTSEELFRDWLSQGSDTPSPPSELYVALHTSNPGNDPDGSSEVDADDYDRASVSTTGGWDTTGTGGPSGFENAEDVHFGEAESDWGTITHVSLWDTDDTSGNAFAAYALTDGSEGEVTDGVDVLFPAGDLSFDID